MGGTQLVRWLLKPVAWAACLGPVAWLGAGILHRDLGADPVKTLTHTTGLSALVILLVTLAISPVRRLTGWNPIIGLRRLLGLFSFFYALLHFLVYAVFDHELSPGSIATDIAEHPWVLVGFSAFLILLVLAATSSRAAVRRLGGRRWQRLHRGIYLAGILAVLHFLWLVKADVTEPLAYGAVLALLLLFRVVLDRRKGRSPNPAPEASRAG